ncbi:MAG: hypothetical protein ACI3Y4_00085 [Candidatus Cryptobacteroides sp.]
MKRNNAFKLLFFGLMIMMLSSCATLKRWVSVPTYAPVEEQLNEIWQGSTYADIVKAYGAPSRSVNDGLGGTIYVYEDIQTEYTTVSNSGVVNGRIDSETKMVTIRNFTEFYVDGNDCCYSVRSNRLEEDGTRISPIHVGLFGIFGVVVVGSILGILFF